MRRRKELAAALEEVQAGNMLEALANLSIEMVDVLDAEGEVASVMGHLLTSGSSEDWACWLSTEGELLARQPGCYATVVQPERVGDFDLEEVTGAIRSLIQSLQV